MKITKITAVALFIFFLGIVLFAFSWLTSFPISRGYNLEPVFYRIPLFYWLSLALLITSMYLLAVEIKSRFLSWVFTVAIVLFFFSLAYFFNLLPGSDSPYFRGLVDYFLKTNNLDSSDFNHAYFQWPAFFMVTKASIAISGLSLFQIEFLQYALIGFLLVSSVYAYSAGFWKNRSPVSIVVFFVIVSAFLNYQDVPFSLALALLFLILLVLENRPRTLPVLIITLILFTSISLTHLFVPLFYVLYLFIMLILKRSKQYGILLLSTIVIYFSVQLTLAMESLDFYIRGIFVLPSEFSSVVNQTLISSSNPVDSIIQVFTRTVTLSFIAITLIAFLILLRKRKFRSMDKAIFMTGLIYSAIGVVLYTLGTRAVPLVFVPACLGAYYFFSHKNGRALQSLFIVLLIFSISIPIHTTLSNPPLMFQTEEGYKAANFMIETYNWSAYRPVLLDTCTMWYIIPQVEPNASLVNTYSPYFVSNFDFYDGVVVSLRLQNELQATNITATEASAAISNYSTTYNSGNFMICEKIE